jgi:hypothetical protein
VSDRIVSDLESFGAMRTQLIDLAEDSGPRTLPYLDLARASSDGRPPVVFEVHGQPYAYVFDARGQEEKVTRWIRRIAFRGDADWIGVLRPGRLDVFRAALGSETPRAIEGLTQGAFLFPSLVHARHGGDAPSVRAALLALLRRSISSAQAAGVSARDALSLVGRALFWRFLVDRHLLDGLDPSDISPRATSWQSCPDTKANALKAFEWLDDTFNGGLLAFNSPSVPSQIKAAVYETVVGNIAHGATAEGQLELRLPAEWREVNFSHVPVGLLSEVYESFAHEAYGEQAKKQSVFYTPRHIAEFVVDEALAALEDVARPRVLDPCAGAGVFLVSAFRALVEREWNVSGAKPSRKMIRRILNEQLVGFDISDDALRLSELALYLTAIELDPDPRPRSLKLLRFDALREQTLFLKDAKQQGSLAFVEPRFRGRFDLVIGNPPWTATRTSQEKRVWVEASLGPVRERLGDERATDFDFPGTNPDLPFVYRATEWLVPKGVIALVTHARWLFAQSRQGIASRRDILEMVHVTGLLNGAALRDSSVWPNVRHPFCLMFAVNEPAPEFSSLQFVSPELERTPDREQRHVRIDWNDARDIAVQVIIDRPWTLKVLFRGSSIDEAIIDETHRRGVTLGQYLESLGTRLCNGYQVGSNPRTQQSAKALLKLLDLMGTDPGFIVDTSTLPGFSLSRVHRPRERSIYEAPLLLVHESMRADPTAPRAILAFEDVAFDERFSGASFANVVDGEKVAAYLQLVIQSSVFVHAAFFLDEQYGVEREVVQKRTIANVPIIPWGALSTTVRKRSVALSERLRGGMTKRLLGDIDTFAADTFELSDVHREAIAETLATALPTATAKGNAARVTLEQERAEFAQVCADELADLLNEDVSVTPADVASGGPWRFVQIDRGSSARETATLDAEQFVQAADQASASLVVVEVTPGTLLVGQLDQFRYWTRTRARLLASSLAAEKMDG